VSPLLLLVAAAGGVALALRKTPATRWPAEAAPFRATIERVAKLHEIPEAVILASIYRESRFNPNAYNPENLNAMKTWACLIAGDPRHWEWNPDYAKAVEVCRRLNAGESAAAVTALWTFGSAGLMQVMRIAASERGGIPYEAPNAILFDPVQNIQAGGNLLSYMRGRVYPGKRSLTTAQWGWVRAAYAGGPGILTQKPERAREIAQAFVETMARF